MNMKAIFETVIRGGSYKLSDMQTKIMRSYIKGDLSEEDHDALLAMASDKANATGEKPSEDERFSTLLQYIEDLRNRVKILEDELFKPEVDEDGDLETPEEDEIAYEKWKPWDGISKKYQTGAIVDHNDKVWESIFPGQNVWEPGTIGTEAMWILYVPKDEEPAETEELVETEEENQ